MTSEGIDHLDFQPEDAATQRALQEMATQDEAAQSNPSTPGWRRLHPKAAVAFATFVMMVPTAALGFGGYEIGKISDDSDRAQAHTLVVQHQRCLAFIGKISRSGDRSLTVNPASLPDSTITDCGLEEVAWTFFDSTNDANLMEGATVVTVQLPSANELKGAIQQDRKASEAQDTLTLDEGAGAFFGGAAGLVGIVSLLGYALRRKDQRRKNEDDESYNS